MLGLTPSHFATQPRPVTEPGDALVLIVHEAPAPARAGGAVPRGLATPVSASTAPVQTLRADVRRLEVDRERAQTRWVQMRCHDLQARHIEQSAAYRYDGIALCGATFLGAVAGVVAGGLYGLVFAAPAWIIGAGAASAATTSGAIVAGRRLYARCARQVHAHFAGTPERRAQAAADMEALTRQLAGAQTVLRTAERLEAIDHAINPSPLPKVLVQIIAGYDAEGDGSQ